MPKRRDSVALVLWAPRFEEVTASIFVSSLRAAGLRVKLVSLSRQPASGSHGLGLVPDLSLEAALPLAVALSCVVLPCGAADVRRLARDPRVRELLYQAQAHHAQLVASAGAGAVLTGLELVRPGNGSLLTYPLNGDLLPFARDLASALVSVPK